MLAMKAPIFAEELPSDLASEQKGNFLSALAIQYRVAGPNRALCVRPRPEGVLSGGPSIFMPFDRTRDGLKRQSPALFFAWARLPRRSR